MRVTIVASWLLAVSAVPGSSQQPSRWAVSLLAGPSSYDLSGVGTAPAVAVGLAWQWTPALVVEPGLTYFRYDPQFGSKITYLFPELSLQLMVPRGPIRPYLGAGAGRSVVLNRPGDHLSVHATVGARVPVTSNWMARGEVRARSPHQWGASMVDIMFGLTWRLP